MVEFIRCRFVTRIGFRADQETHGFSSHIARAFYELEVEFGSSEYTGEHLKHMWRVTQAALRSEYVIAAARIRLCIIRISVSRSMDFVVCRR